MVGPPSHGDSPVVVDPPVRVLSLDTDEASDDVLRELLVDPFGAAQAQTAIKQPPAQPELPAPYISSEERVLKAVKRHINNHSFVQHSERILELFLCDPGNTHPWHNPVADQVGPV